MHANKWQIKSVNWINDRVSTLLMAKREINSQEVNAITQSTMLPR